MSATNVVFYTNAARTSLEERKSRGLPLELLDEKSLTAVLARPTSGENYSDNGQSIKSRKSGKMSVQVESMPKGKRSSFKLKPTSSKVVVTQTGADKAIIKESVEEQNIGIDFDASAVNPLALNTSSSPPSSSFHILVLGVQGSGATSFAARFIGERLDNGFASRVAKCGEHYAPVSVQVVHSASELNERSMRQACGAVIVCDSAAAGPTVRGACQWKKEIDAARTVLGLPKLFTVLAANKYDGASKIRAGEKQVEELVQKEGVSFDCVLSASALTGLNVDNAFDAVIETAASKAPSAMAQPEIIKAQAISISVEGNPSAANTSGDASKCVIC